MVQPVSIPDPAPTPGLLEASLTWEPAGWVPTNFHLPEYLEAAADVTTVNLSGTAQAFALSFADVVHLSTETGPFPTFRLRAAARDSWWWTRTPSNINNINAWVILHSNTVYHPSSDGSGYLAPRRQSNAISLNGGVRPALIINQSN